ncbi:hypothetical protein EPI10_023272 [Gossypium australe]|uniref:Uncharacterized protein n=1 Tax=Gossypium australe TaxID=47621 RepID=A0A5B6VUI5_9ROSI|nr:hypothetical protein EPI10_023272 [Gossypium australe]
MDSDRPSLCIKEFGSRKDEIKRIAGKRNSSIFESNMVFMKRKYVFLRRNYLDANDFFWLLIWCSGIKLEVHHTINDILVFRLGHNV